MKNWNDSSKLIEAKLWMTSPMLLLFWGVSKVMQFRRIQTKTKLEYFPPCVSGDHHHQPCRIETGPTARRPLCSWQHLPQTAPHVLHPQARGRPHRHSLCPGTAVPHIQLVDAKTCRSWQACAAFATTTSRSPMCRRRTGEFQRKNRQLIVVARSRRPSLASGPAFTHLSRSEPSDENYVKVLKMSCKSRTKRLNMKYPARGGNIGGAGLVPRPAGDDPDPPVRLGHGLQQGGEDDVTINVMGGTHLSEIKLCSVDGWV